MTHGGDVEDDSRSFGLLEFTHPPLVEVAVGLTFHPLGLRAVDLARLHLTWQSEYPRYEEHAAIPSSPLVPGLILEPGVPRLRLWFIGTGGRLVQIQRDRLVVNWRTERDSSDYPRYDALRAELEVRFREFADFAEEAGLPRPSLNAVELTYVNRIPFDDTTTHLADVVSLLHAPPAELGLPVETSVSVRFDASTQVGHEPATLTVDVQRSPNTDPPAAIIQLSCISPVTDAADAFRTLDRARAHVVRSFQLVTTDDMHRKWGVRR